MIDHTNLLYYAVTAAIPLVILGGKIWSLATTIATMRQEITGIQATLEKAHDWRTGHESKCSVEHQQIEYRLDKLAEGITRLTTLVEHMDRGEKR